jgi:DNA-3-methyladenine glycosylase
MAAVPSTDRVAGYCAGPPLPPAGVPLPSSFFARPADDVAPDLVGKVLWRQGVGGGRLVEVEAYLPGIDPAAHGYRGLTPRNRALFGPPGVLYVYRSYGLHFCVNVSCFAEGLGTGVLFRAFEPLGDLTGIRRNRGDAVGSLPETRLASGPGNLGRALGADLGWNGVPFGEDSGIFVFDDGVRPQVERTRRIGISRARELPLRYIIPASRFLSRGPRRGSPVLEGRGEHEAG